MDVALYFHTVRHLRPRQLGAQLLRRLPGRGVVQPVVREPSVRSGLGALTELRPLPVVDTGGHWRFLNVSGAAVLAATDWDAPGMSRLWRYNLHYFDCLRDPQLPRAQKVQLIDAWIEKVPFGARDAWDAYPVSVRIVNWVKFFIELGPERIPRAWLVSLARQAQWLATHLEYHLQANHLLKNAVALCFAGAYLSGAQADRQLRRGWRLFTEQVLEQFLPDGGHYERSPMYHALCLIDSLDVLSLARQPPLRARLAPPPRLLERIRAACGFLRDVSAPDGELPLFNDSAFGIVQPPARILEYAGQVLTGGVEAPSALHSARDGLIEKSASGYYGFRRGGDWLLIDCGAVGPDHQPGHAHCDTLSYELSLDGQRIVVDTGVHDYEAGGTRQLARRSSSHNTVTIDGCEQSQIWGAFRVGRRARPLAATLAGDAERGRFEGAHDGFCRLPGKPVHRRTVEWNTAGIAVVDEVQGGGWHRAESRVRLHPGYTPVIQAGYAVICGPDGQPAARLEFTSGVRPELEDGQYFPEFGRAAACRVLVFRVSGELPLRIAYRIHKAPRA